MEPKKYQLNEVVKLRLTGVNNIFHKLIEGDNLPVLRILLQSMTNCFDVICIDPPYNTGQDYLTYSDHQLIETTPNQKGKSWIDFMSERIEISQKLLSEKGVLFINIDEHEISNLTQLCKYIFNSKNVDVLIWPKTDIKYDANRVDKPFDNIKIIHEYIIVCFKNKSSTSLNKISIPTDDEGKENLKFIPSILTGLGTTSSAKDELCEIFGSRDVFQTPKPRKLIKELVRSASTKKSLILDFFAGSGTTGVAVSELNAEDGGKRKYILVNNNENNICRNITFERLKKTKEKENFPLGLRYYKLESDNK